MFYIGCHLSASDGFLAMGRTALSIGANTFQFFTRNPRGSKAKAIDPADVAAFLALAAENEFGTLVAHAPYTINPCSKDEHTREFARMTLADDLKRMEHLPGNVYNFHPGSHTGQGMETGIGQIAETLNAILTPGLRTTVLLETMSGKGSEVGSRFEELREIIDRVALSDKLGVCLDTCHVSDAGYDIADDLDGVLTEFDRVIGLIAGGDGALRRAVENAEDDTAGAWRDMAPYHPTADDVLVGIAASGTTPYVVGGLRMAREHGLLTASITCNPSSPVAAEAEYALEAVVGPEFVTGSTRMKAGTAQKLMLNMLSTAVMIRLGRVEGNRMVNMQLTNDKLVGRGTRMVAEASGLSEAQARALLLQYGSVKKALEHAPKPE